MKTSPNFISFFDFRWCLSDNAIARHAAYLRLPGWKQTARRACRQRIQPSARSRIPGAGLRLARLPRRAGAEIINCGFAPEYVDRALVNCPSLQAVLSTSLKQFCGDLLDGGPADCILHGSNGTIRRLMEAMLREYEQKLPIFSAGTWACPRASCGGLTDPWFDLWK